MRNSKGFSLIELVIVIVVIGILSAVAIPKFGDLRGDAQNVVKKQAVATLNTSLEVYKIREGRLPSDLNVLVKGLPENATTGSSSITIVVAGNKGACNAGYGFDPADQTFYACVGTSGAVSVTDVNPTILLVDNQGSFGSSLL